MHKSLYTVALTTLGLGLFSSSASAISLSFVDHDNDFNALNPELAFVAEGRIGNNAMNGTHELNFHGINPANPTATSDQADFVWDNGTETDFELTYNALTGAVTYTVNGTTLNATANDNAVNDIFLRVRATQADTSILLDNLFLDGEAIGDSLSVTGGGAWAEGMEYLRISDFTGDFKLTGTSTMTWGDTRPNNSNLAYQIKVGTADGGSEPEPVPEPVSSLGLLLGAAGLVLSRRAS
jgi:hypothetical protein